MFERLTADKVYLNSIRFGIQVNFPPHCGHEKAKEVDDFVKNVFDRLAAYEDSGLSPEEVQELAQAKADGRLVVLPCKVGDTLFLIKHGYIEEAKVRTIFIGHPSYNRGEPEPNLMMIRCTNFDLPIDAIGKTAFLSREAAEKALERSGQDGCSERE